MDPIVRQQTNPRLSRIVVHRGLVHLAGVTAIDRSQDIAGQTRQVLARIDEQLLLADSDKSLMLTAQLILRDVEGDIKTVNEIWEEWISPHPGPARAASGGKLVAPDILLEAIVSAVVRD